MIYVIDRAAAAKVLKDADMITQRGIVIEDMSA